LVNKVPQMVKAAFKMAKPVEYGTAIGEAVGAPKMLLGKAIGLGTNVASINKSYGEITGDTTPVVGRMGGIFGSRAGSPPSAKGGRS